MNAALEQFVSKTQAAAELGISYATLDRRVKAGLIPAYQLGREVVFRVEDVEKAKQPTPKVIEAR